MVIGKPLNLLLFGTVEIWLCLLAKTFNKVMDNFPDNSNESLLFDILYGYNMGCFNLLFLVQIDSFGKPLWFFSKFLILDPRAYLQMFFKLGSINKHPFLIGTLYLVCLIWAMSCTVLWSLDCWKFALSSFTGYVEFAGTGVRLLFLL